MSFIFNPVSNQLERKTRNVAIVHVKEFGIKDDPTNTIDQTANFKKLGDWARTQNAVEIHCHYKGTYRTGIFDVLNVPIVKIIGNDCRLYTTLNQNSRTNYIGFCNGLDLPYIQNTRSPNNLGGAFGEAYKAEYFESAIQGASTITLTSIPEAADYKVGDRCFLYGKETQANFGYPPNKFYFEWKEVKAVDYATGTVTFTERLRYSYDSRWHAGIRCFRYQTLPYWAIGMENRFTGTPYQWRFATYKETDYLYVENLTADIIWTSGNVAELKNVSVLDYLNITTQRQITIDGGTYRDIEVDKFVNRVYLKNAKLSRVTGATGCDYLEVINCDLDPERGSIKDAGQYALAASPRTLIFKQNRVWENFTISITSGWAIHQLEISNNLFYVRDNSTNNDKFLFTPPFNLTLGSKRTVIIGTVTNTNGRTSFTFDAEEQADSAQANPLLKQYSSFFVNSWYPGLVLTGSNIGQKFIVSNVYRDNATGLSYCEGRTTFPLTAGGTLTFNTIFNQVECSKNIIVGAQADNQLYNFYNTYPTGGMVAVSFEIDTFDYNNRNVYTQMAGRIYGYRIWVKKAAGASATLAPIRLFFQNLAFASYSKSININGKIAGLREVMLDRVSGLQTNDILPTYNGEYFEQIRLQLFGDVHTLSSNDCPVVNVTLYMYPSQFNQPNFTPT
jgi:hypothetical protein